MQIIAHRGYWLTQEERNSREAFSRAFRSGFGIETDIRDLDGEIVISHDLPSRDTSLPLTTMLADYIDAGCPGTLALNIKSDGLAAPLKALLETYGTGQYFCFDMSVPDTFSYLRCEMPAAARLSEYEPEGHLSEMLPVLWVDGFHSCQLSPDRLAEWLFSGKQVCLVSPELHRRDAASLWTLLQALPEYVRSHPALMLCTDNPLQAQRIFNQ